MKRIDAIYCDGAFVKPRGTATHELVNPTTGEPLGQAVLGDETDIHAAVAAAKRAFRDYSRTSLDERAALLERLHAAVAARGEELTRVAIQEYGSPLAASARRARSSAQNFLRARDAMREFEFERRVGKARVVFEPLGVAGLITPWNANYTQLSKLAFALAAGCTVVVKPSELSALQTHVFTECLHEAGIPAGVVNIVNGAGAVAGAALVRHPDVAMVSFTGSTRVGKSIRREAVETMKRVTLELGGKSPNLILNDADFTKAIPMAAAVAFSNSGQACHAGSRLLVPAHRLDEVKALLRQAVAALKVGDPAHADTALGPLVSQKQYDAVQRYIASGLDEGAELVLGGLGRPEGLERGFFARPTVFAQVTGDMAIAREEIFGPVLCLMTYATEDEAVDLANDTIYGLSAYLSTADAQKAGVLARRLVAGSVLINQGVHDEPMAPFGGFKQSGIGREHGVYGLRQYLEPKTVLGGGE